jgi:hypothetical protein
MTATRDVGLWVTGRHGFVDTWLEAGGTKGQRFLLAEQDMMGKNEKKNYITTDLRKFILGNLCLSFVGFFYLFGSSTSCLYCFAFFLIFFYAALYACALFH